MKKIPVSPLLALLALSLLPGLAQADNGFATAVPFADGGSLKMLYDNRMHPQALEFEGKVYIVSRGVGGIVPGMLLFYGWQGVESAAYLWDNRP